MKIKLLFFSILLLASFKLQAQEDEDDHVIPDIEQDNVRATGKNEVSVNVFNVIVLAALNVSYERILSENASVEANVFAKFKEIDEEDGLDADEIFAKDFAVTGSYNWFFSETKRARGFYMKGFLMYSTGDYDEYINYSYDNNGNYQENYESTEFSDLAIGVGGKFMHKKGFFTDLHFGIGRNLFNDDSPEIIALFDVNLGFRF